MFNLDLSEPNVQDITAPPHVSLKYIYQGKTMAEWAAELGVLEETARQYYKKHGNLDACGGKKWLDGMTMHQLVAKTGHDRNLIARHIKKYGHLDNLRKKWRYDGKDAKEWSAIIGVPYNTIRRWIKEGIVEQKIQKKLQAIDINGKQNSQKT